MAESDHVEANRRSRERARVVLEAFTDAVAAEIVAPGWTKGALLAHLAFWDRLACERWRRVIAGDARMDWDDRRSDMLNDGLLPQWRAMPAGIVRAEFLSASAAVDELIATATPTLVATLLADGRERLVHRSRHRNEHLDQIH